MNARILRNISPELFELESFDEVPRARPRVIRDADVDLGPEEATYPRNGVLPAGAATISAEPFDVSLELLKADFPVDDHQEDEPAEVEPDAEQIRAALDAEWEQRLAETEARVREEAYQEGRADAEEELRASIEETRTAITSGLKQLNEAIRAHLKDLEPLVVEFALDVAESILADEPTDGAKRAAEQDLARAVEQLAGDGAIDVYVHPVDLLRLQESGFVGQVSGAISGIRWHADDTMEEGDWSAKSSMAAVRRVRAEMLDGIRERLGLDRNVPEEL